MSGGLRYRNIAHGWNAEAYGRWLAVHADALPEEQGFGFRLRYDPDTLGFGPWASLGQIWGQPSSVLPGCGKTARVGWSPMTCWGGAWIWKSATACQPMAAVPRSPPTAR